MPVNIILILITLISSIKAVSFGVWTWRDRNISGAIAVIAFTAAVLVLVTMYIVSEYSVIK